MLKEIGGLLREVMDGAVYVRVVVAIKVRHGIDNDTRLLRGRAVVKVREGASVHGLGERGEVGADANGIEREASHRSIVCAATGGR